MKGIPEGLRSRAWRWGELWGVPDLADSGVTDACGPLPW